MTNTPQWVLDYEAAQPIHGDRWLVFEQMLFSYRLSIANEQGKLFSWDYSTRDDALEDLWTWDGQTPNPPGPWIKNVMTGERR